MTTRTRITGVIWIGRVYERWAWGDVTRNHILGLKQIGYPVKVCPVGAIHYDVKQEVDHYIQPLLNADVGSCPAVVIDKGLELIHQVTTNGLPTIGRILFETDRVPASIVADSHHYDEVWVPSRFNVETFSRSGVSPERLRVIPYAVNTDIYRPRVEQWPIPDKRRFVFLDVLSLGWNKGFDLLVEAYFKEFTAQDDVTLVLKVLSSGQRRERPTAKDIILGAVRGRVDLERKDLPHLVVLDETLSRERMLDLYAACDLYISLSRANGWGMAFAEAMAMGKPASGIDWSGNTEFMNRTNSLMIETTGRLVPVDPRFVAQAPNFAGHRWADVEVQEVQRVMRYAYEHSTELKQIAERGMKDIREHYSLVAVARRVVAALSDMPVSATRHRGRPRVRFKNALGLKFRARLLYHRWRYRLFALLRRPPA